MSLKAWKCYNCEAKGTNPGGFDFEAEKPVCPQCTADGSTPRGRHAVLPRVVMHFDPPTAVVGVGENAIACRPTVNIIGNRNGIRATGEPSVVTCEACKATDAYKNASKGAVDLSNAVTLPDGK